MYLCTLDPNTNKLFSHKTPCEPLFSFAALKIITPVIILIIVIAWGRPVSNSYWYTLFLHSDFHQILNSISIGRNYFLVIYEASTTSWELWKHPDPVPGGRPIFFKPEWPKESKNGFKTISCRPPLLLIFSKYCFSAKKLSKKLDVLLIFEFLWQYIWTN